MRLRLRTRPAPPWTQLPQSPLCLTSNYFHRRIIYLTGEHGETLRQFLHDSVKTFEELESLLFLARHPDQDFSAEAVTAALDATAGSIDEALEELANVGELVKVTRAGAVRVYRYAPRDESIRQRVAELEAAYRERRMTVVQMLSTNALERVRRAAMRRLADAFRMERRRK